MRIKLRFALLIGSLLVGLVCALLTQQWLEHRELTRQSRHLHQQQSRQLDRWLTTTADSLDRYTAECAAGFARGAPEWTLADPADSGVTAIWITREDGSLLRTIAAPGLAAPPLPANEISLWIQTPPPERFFAEVNGRLLELRVHPLPADTNWSVAGWAVAARPWDDGHLSLLALLTEGKVGLRDPASAAPAPAGSQVRTLSDWRGAALRTLVVEYPDTGDTGLWRMASPHLPLFLGFGLLLITALGLSLQQWVLRPLARINTSLAHGSPQPIMDLRSNQDELGRIARLVEETHARQEELRREIEKRQRTEHALLASEDQLRRALEERIRLGRDLHDGVIQSLYATGMGLAGVRALLAAGQTEAALRLEQIRDSLNATIHDVRNFITGLEPEILRQQTFAQAIEDLLQQMSGLGPARGTCTIDGTLAERLTLIVLPDTLFQCASPLFITAYQQLEAQL
jgi:signal transduction histidine kinase